MLQCSVGGSYSDASSQDGCDVHHGIRIYLSAVKEWVIEFGASMLSISIRTDGAWYRLGKPSQLYRPWFTPVRKTAELAIEAIKMLDDETRVSRLSFTDVIKKLAEQPPDAKTYISSKPADVERYVVVHGQIILQQFAEYPSARIKKCVFVSGLTSRMEHRHHTKLLVSKKKTKVSKKERNLNPTACVGPDVKKQKPMRATTTSLVNRIWSSYYNKYSLENEEAGSVPEHVSVEELGEEDSDTGEDSISELDADFQVKPVVLKESSKKTDVNSFKWLGNAHGLGRPMLLYQKAYLNCEEICVGAAVLVNRSAEAQKAILLVEYLYETKMGLHMLHGRVLERGVQTVLGNAADKREVFLVNQCMDVEIEKTLGVFPLEFRKRPWGYRSRKANFKLDEMERFEALENEQKGLPPKYFCKAFYCADKGAFFSLPTDRLGKGDGSCQGCEHREKEDNKNVMQLLQNKDGFRLNGVDYLKDDYVYLDPASFKSHAENKSFDMVKASRNKGLRAFEICQLLAFQSEKTPATLSVRRFYRPEDLGPEKAYKADLHEARPILCISRLTDGSCRVKVKNRSKLVLTGVLIASLQVYYTEELAEVDAQKLRGKCVVLRPADIQYFGSDHSPSHVFSCSCIYDSKTGSVKQVRTLFAAWKLGWPFCPDFQLIIVR